MILPLINKFFRGFKRLPGQGARPDVVAYHHHLFTKDSPELLKKLTSEKSKFKMQVKVPSKKVQSFKNGVQRPRKKIPTDNVETKHHFSQGRNVSSHIAGMSSQAISLAAPSSAVGNQASNAASLTNNIDDHSRIQQSCQETRLQSIPKPSIQHQVANLTSHLQEQQQSNQINENILHILQQQQSIINAENVARASQQQSVLMAAEFLAQTHAQAQQQHNLGSIKTLLQQQQEQRQTMLSASAALSTPYSVNSEQMVLYGSSLNHSSGIGINRLQTLLSPSVARQNGNNVVTNLDNNSLNLANLLQNQIDGQGLTGLLDQQRRQDDQQYYQR